MCPLKAETAYCQAEVWKRKTVRELPNVKRIELERGLGDLASPQLTGNQEMGNSDINLSSSLNELGSQFFPTASGKESSYPDTLLLVCRLLAPQPEE